MSLASTNGSALPPAGWASTPWRSGSRNTPSSKFWLNDAGATIVHSTPGFRRDISRSPGRIRHERLTPGPGPSGPPSPAPGHVRPSQPVDDVFALQQQRAQVGRIHSLSRALRLADPLEPSHATQSAKGRGPPDDRTCPGITPADQEGCHGCLPSSGTSTLAVGPASPTRAPTAVRPGRPKVCPTSSLGSVPWLLITTTHACAVQNTGMARRCPMGLRLRWDGSPATPGVGTASSRPTNA